MNTALAWAYTVWVIDRLRARLELVRTECGLDSQARALVGLGAGLNFAQFVSLRMRSVDGPGARSRPVRLPAAPGRRKGADRTFARAITGQGGGGAPCARSLLGRAAHPLVGAERELPAVVVEVLGRVAVHVNQSHV
jgi:hypothetical protein